MEEQRTPPAAPSRRSGKRQTEVERQLKLFQAIFSNAPTGIAVLRGPELICELVNPALQALAPAKLMLGRSFLEVCPEIAGQVAPSISEALSTGKPYSATDVPLRVRRAPEGHLETIYLTFTCVPLRDPTGQYDSLLVLLQNTTREVRERERAEAVGRVAEGDRKRLLPERQVEFDIVPDAVASAHPQLLRIALENLLGNAWKFTSKRPAARIEFGVTRQDDKPVYYVRDWRRFRHRCCIAC